MNTIWKYQLELTDRQDIVMPIGSKILCVQAQRGTLCLWVLVNTNSPTNRRVIAVHGTGFPIADNEFEIGRYIGSVQMHNGDLVWHVVDLGEDDVEAMETKASLAVR